MGGGGFLGLGPAPSAPAAPDYTAAAQATAASNLDAARAASAANRVNQVTPYGNLTYNQTGTDQYGNPTYTATTSLSDVGQQLLNNQNATSLGLNNSIQAQLGQVNNTMGQGFNPNLPGLQYSAGQTPNLQKSLGGTGMQGWQQATNDVLQTLAPQLQHQSEMSDAKLANQGIQPGSEAYKNYKTQEGINQNNLLAQASLAGQNVQQNLFNQNLAAGQFGNAAQNQQFQNQLTNANLNNATQQQGYNQALTNYNLPLNTLNALRTGAQVQNPSFTSVPQQATTSGANYSGAAANQYGAAMGNFNAQQAAQGGLNSGLFGLGAAGISAFG